jgi:multiple sugar transport system permease protein
VRRAGPRALATLLATYAAALALLAVFLVPVLWMLSTALANRFDLYTATATLLPARPSFDAFGLAWQGTPYLPSVLPRAFVNSVVYALLSAAGNAALGLMAGFALARLRFPGRDILWLLVLATMMVPTAAIIIPLFNLMFSIPFTARGGWLNTYQGLILPTLVTGSSIFLIRQYLLTLPRELDEQAAIDGCGPYRTLLAIILPLSWPALGAVSILTALAAWNSYLWPVVVGIYPDMFTLQEAMRYLQTTYSYNWPLLMAASVVATLPILLLYIALQPLFEQSLAALGDVR